MLYLIIYDLNQPEQNYTRLHEVIKTLGPSYCRCMESAWLVRSDLDEEICASQLGQTLGANDRVLVIDVAHQPMQGMLPQRVWDWIKESDE